MGILVVLRGTGGNCGVGGRQALRLLVAVELTGGGGLGQAACPERINLASFGSGQVVGRDGMTVSGWSCRDCGCHLVGWQPIRTCLFCCQVIER